MPLIRPLLLVVPLATLLSSSVGATTIVRLEPAHASLSLGAETTLSVVADFDTPVLGFGLDLVLSGFGVVLLDDPMVGTAWTPVAAPDGDGLAGLAPPGGIVGTGVLLATVGLQASALGAAEVVAAVTSGDLTEGFALLGGGFDDIVFEAIAFEVPEPATALLLCLGLAAAAISVSRST